MAAAAAALTVPSPPITPSTSARAAAAFIASAHVVVGAEFDHLGGRQHLAERLGHPVVATAAGVQADHRDHSPAVRPRRLRALRAVPGGPVRGGGPGPPRRRAPATVAPSAAPASTSLVKCTPVKIREKQTAPASAPDRDRQRGELLARPRPRRPPPRPSARTGTSWRWGRGGRSGRWARRAAAAGDGAPPACRPGWPAGWPPRSSPGRGRPPRRARVLPLAASAAANAIHSLDLSAARVSSGRPCLEDRRQLGGADPGADRHVPAADGGERSAVHPCSLEAAACRCAPLPPPVGPLLVTSCASGGAVWKGGTGPNRAPAAIPLLRRALVRPRAAAPEDSESETWQEN